MQLQLGRTHRTMVGVSLSKLFLFDPHVIFKPVSSAQIIVTVTEGGRDIPHTRGFYRLHDCFSGQSSRDEPVFYKTHLTEQFNI